MVLISNTNLIRAQWKLGRVMKTFPRKDGKVQKVEMQYKNPHQGESVKEYKGHGYVTVD